MSIDCKNFLKDIIIGESTEGGAAPQYYLVENSYSGSSSDNLH